MRLPSSLTHQQRNALRLILAVAGSVAVHAAAVSLYVPAGGGGPAGASQPPLHAFLAPADPRPAASAAKDLGASGEAHPGPSGIGAGEAMPAPDRWFRRSELDRVAAPITAVTLDYLENAKSVVTARVQLRLFIDERGLVRKLTIEESASDRAFDAAAAKAWGDVRFSPAMKDGATVKSQQVIEVEFQPELAQR